MTPVYLFEQDAASFHAYWKGLCDGHGPALYPRFKAWCDEYFYIPARREHRGIGGIFFDDMVSGAEGEPADAEKVQFLAPRLRHCIVCHQGGHWPGRMSMEMTDSGGCMNISMNQHWSALKTMDIAAWRSIVKTVPSRLMT